MICEGCEGYDPISPISGIGWCKRERAEIIKSVRRSMCGSYLPQIEKENQHGGDMQSA